MDYVVKLTEYAEEQVLEIIKYIKYTLKASESGENIGNKLKKRNCLAFVYAAPSCSY